MNTTGFRQSVVCLSIGLLYSTILSGQPDCNTPLVGKGAVVDDISGDLVALLAFEPEWQNAIDGDLTNFTTIELTDVTGIGDVSLISIKYAEQNIAAGRRAGFVLDIENTLGGLLGADILNSLEINTYLDNTLQETASVGGGGPAISLNLTGGESGIRRVDFLTTEAFDEIELVFTGVATTSLLSEFHVYYAFHMEDGCDHNCVIALTTDNFDATVTSGCTGILCGLNDFDDPELVIDSDTTDFDDALIVVLGTAWLEIEIGEDIPAGYDVGFAIANDGVLGLELLSLEALAGITITTKDNEVVQETFTFDALANVGVLTGNINQISFKTTEDFDEVRITFSALISLLNTWEVYYGFIRPDSDIDYFPDCVDACPMGDDNFDEDGDGIPDECDDSCVISAGADQAACTDGTTAQLSAAPSGFTWTAVAGNPSSASVNNNGEVTGLDAEGTYLFALSNGVCSDTVAVNYLETQGSSLCNNPLTGPDVIVDNEPNEVINDANVVDGNLSNYASDGNFIDLLLAIGGTETEVISVKDTANSYPAGTRVGYVVSFPGGLAEVNLFDAIGIRTYLNDVEVETSISGGSSLADADALGVNGQQRISMVATEEFDEVELVAIGGIITVDLSLINELRVYYAFTEPDTCAGGDGGFGNAGCETALNCESSYAANINFDTTGLQGIACALCDLTSLSHLIDIDLDNFTTMDLTAGVLGEANVSIILNEAAPAGATTGYVVKIGGGLLGAGILDAFELNTYLDGDLQESLTTNNPLVHASVLFADSDLTYFSFTSTMPFDEVQFVADANLLSAGVGGTEIDIYYAFVQFDSDGDGVPDCRDKCCLGDDNMDEDGDGVPDACDDLPDAVNDTVTVTEDMQFEVDVLDNDDFGGDGPGGDSIQVIRQPDHGTAVVDNNGTPSDPTDDTVLYTPDPDYAGEDSLQYVICDSDLDCDTAWVYFIVEPVNDPPIAIDDINNTPQDEPASGNVLTNDEDPEGDNLTVNTTPVDEPNNGDVVLNPDGSYTYTPDPGFTGQDQFSYQVCDDGTPQQCDTAVVYINVIGDPADGNLPPAANPDANQTEVDTPISGDLLSNDDDPNGDNLVINTTPVDGPNNGMVMINGDGTYTYTPDPGFIGQDTFYYQVCDDQMPALCATTIVVITVLPDNGNNTFAHDDAAVTNEDEDIMGNVSDNDFDPEGDDQTVNTTPVSGPANGTVTLAADGTYTYSPDPGFVGNDFFTYEACDDGMPMVCDTATVSIAVLSANDPPLAVDDINNTPQDEPASGNVLTNDEDPDNDDLAVNTMPVVDPANGNVTLNADGSYTYTPDPGFSGEDQFSYQVCDNGTPQLCDTAVVYIEVIPNPDGDNRAPIANPDANQTEEDTPVNGDLLSNDSDPDGDNLVINTTPVVDAANGTVIINGDGTYTYTPDMGFTGQDVFVYEVCDDGMPVLCDTAVVVIDVLPDVGNSTYANDDAAVTNEDTPVMGNVSDNDFDPEGHSQTVNATPVIAPINGTLVLLADGSYTYTPDPGFVGNDFFVYEACDNAMPPVCDNATVYIAVLPANNPPLAVDDINNTPQDEPASGNVLTNDEDPDNDDLAVNTMPVVDPANGDVTLNADGSYTYTPDPGFSGEDQFSYQVCDNGTPQLCDTAVVYIEVIPNPDGDNRAPIANPDANQTEEDTPVSGDLLSNDSDPDGDNLVINTTPVVDAANGTVIINGDGTYTYTPDMGFTGQDVFVYAVCDDGMPVLCDTAVVVIDVLPDVGNSTYANDDAAVTNEDTPVMGNVSDNDFDPEGHTQTVNATPVIAPINGTVVLFADGSYTYTPDPGFVGNDFFVYEACDNAMPPVCDNATVYIAVLPANNPPLAVDDINNTPQDEPASGNVLTNDEDPDNDDLTVNTMPVVDPANGNVTLNADGSYTYTPDPGFSGEDQFSYQVCDNGTPQLCDTAVVYIEVIPNPDGDNRAPIANPDANQTEEDTPVNGDLLSNDSDPDGDNLVINTTPVVDAANGTVIINGDGTYTYTPDMGFTGQDVFVYEVCDDGMPVLCDTAVVVIDVLPDVGNSTYANDDAAVTNEDTPVMGNVSDNDFDPEGHSQTVNATPVIAPINGTVVLLADGSYTYTPDPGFVGNDFFVYEACDNAMPPVCDNATVYIAVLPANNPPVAVDDINVMPQDEPASGNVLTNDEDPDGDDLTVNPTPVDEPDNGTVVLNADGSYTYTPDPGFSGEDQFSYEVCDNGTPQLCDIAVVYLEVIPDSDGDNRPPIANPDANQTEEDTPVNGDLLSNDSDPDGDNLVINTTPIVDAANGTVVINGDGTYTYTPDMGFTGQDVFVYEVCDDGMPVLCDTAVVVIDVLPDVGNSTYANDDAVVTSVNTPVGGDVTQNDFDPEGDIQSVSTTPVSDASNGTVLINTNGTFTYTPDPGFIGNDFFTYQTCDDGMPQVCDTATVYVAVIPRCVRISTWVYLEGSLIDDQGQGIYGSEMRTDLNDLRILPGQLVVDPFLGDQYTAPLGAMNQVYNVDPWNYVGNEGAYYDSDSVAANADADYPSTVTDWVLVSLRTDPNDGDEVLCQRAALLHKNGRVEFVDEEDCCQIDMSLDYYIVIEHRNHLLVMSDVAIPITGDSIAYDFRVQQSYDEDPFMIGLVGQKEVVPDVFAMYAGNCDQSSTADDDTDINSSDFNRWDNENNQFLLYIIGDIDMNGDVNSNDFNLWQENEQTLTAVIRN